MNCIPILETARIRLRPHCVADFDAMLALWSDPATIRFIGGQVQDAQAIWFRLLRYAGMWALLGFGFWVIEDKVSGRYLGEGGLMDGRRGIALLDGVPEIGWALTSDAGGRGLATEAVEAIVRWSDKELGALVTRCIIDPGNAASLRVAAKCGYAEIGRAGVGGSETIVLERLRATPR
jgi:RimJ/RimL family protein N-acetyltransferase